MTTSLARSIQGERQLALASAPTKMDQDDVDEYMASVSREVQACRERGRHLIPTTAEAGIVFSGVTDDGLLIQERECVCCGLVARVTYWHRAPGRHSRWRPVTSRLVYHSDDARGRYLAPAGQGRITPKRAQLAAVNHALQGVTMLQARKTAMKKGVK